ncbi:DUF7282 domain-containing protein [Natrinema ejinorense]|uniref:DUF7282 domain-containing protein n=1 Tax=Natrinema ejinorense TaxID=373386 RepID=A0A2A5QQN2_9EURY|nr:hypothetical protein [Natrinema ejinorense]PCR89168.1 hypothetical protein CP557_00615 [Natrinema ejinorense]
MNARNQLLVVLTALMLVCSSGAMVVAATSGDAIDQSNDVSEDEYDTADNESTEETADEQEVAETADDTDAELEPDADSENESDGSQGAYVTFNDQTIEDDTVVVENVSLASPGFVTIHDSSLLEGNVLESVIGTSEYLEAGTYENVEITLDESLEDEDTLIAMPHRDTNANQEYDFVESEGMADTPFTLADSEEPVTDDALVTIDGVDDEEPADDDETDEDELDEEPFDDNETDEDEFDEEPFDDNETDEDELDEEPFDDNETDEDDLDEEPFDDNETDEDELDEEPMDEEPMDELPIDGDEQPIFVTVEELSVEDVNLENTTVYVLVVGEDIDADELPDEIDNVTDEDDLDEVPIDDNETDEDEFDEEPIDDNETDEDDLDEEPIDDNETDEDDLDEVPIDDNETDEDDLDEEPIDDNETDEDDLDEVPIDDNETDEDDLDEVPIDDNETDEDDLDEEPIDDNETDEDELDEDGVVTAEPFNVSNLSAPESATVGETITVTATITNPADEERTESVQFRLEGDLVAEQNLTLEGDESTDVEFEVDTTGIPAGDYVHMVLTDQTGEVAFLELTEDTDEDDLGEDDLDEEPFDDNETDEDDTNETDDGLEETDENDTADDSGLAIGLVLA